MADLSIRFIDVPTQSAIDVKAYDNGDGTFALAMSSGPRDPDKVITFRDTQTGADVPVGVVDLNDGTYAISVVPH